PVQGVTIEPSTVTVAVATRPALVTKEVSLELTEPAAANLESVSLSSALLAVAGPEPTLAQLEAVTGTVDAPTGNVEPGRYTLPVRLELPEGVVALTSPTVTLQYSREPLRP